MLAPSTLATVTTPTEAEGNRHHAPRHRATDFPRGIRINDMGSALSSDRPAILIEFGPLTFVQQAFVDLHTLRAAGTEGPLVETDGVIVEFWLREGETAATLYDDIRGWAIGNGLPFEE